MISSKLVGEAIECLNSIKAHTIQLVWVKTHIGNAGNEKVNKQGTSSSDWVKVPELHNSGMGEPLTKLQAGRQSKQFLPCLNSKAAMKTMGLPRFKLGRFVQLVTGHNNLNYHMSLCNPEHSAVHVSADFVK